MGWPNSVPVLHDDVTYILQPEIPHVMQPYIDNIPVKGPATRYIKEDGEPKSRHLAICLGTFSRFKLHSLKNEV